MLKTTLLTLLPIVTFFAGYFLTRKFKLLQLQLMEKSYNDIKNSLKETQTLLEMQERENDKLEKYLRSLERDRDNAVSMAKMYSDDNELLRTRYNQLNAKMNINNKNMRLRNKKKFKKR